MATIDNLLRRVTDPLLEPVRRLLPAARMGGMALDLSPIITLNRAVAVAEVNGPAKALAEVDRLTLEGYHPWHVVRADLLRRLGRRQQSRAALTRAIELSGNPGEIAYLTRRRHELTDESG